MPACRDTRLPFYAVAVLGLVVIVVAERIRNQEMLPFAG